MTATARLRNGPASGCVTRTLRDVLWVAVDLRADGRPVPVTGADGLIHPVVGRLTPPPSGRDRRWECYRRRGRDTAGWDACWRPELDLPGSEDPAYVWVPPLRVVYGGGPP